MAILRDRYARKASGTGFVHSARGFVNEMVKRALAGGASDGSLEFPFTDAEEITITHTLGKEPIIQVFDFTNDEVMGGDDYDYQRLAPDGSTFKLSWYGPITGKVVLE